MSSVLQSKRESSRFQILVEIAAHQPNLRQKEVAESLGVTPQAISEYIKELVADGLVLDTLSMGMSQDIELAVAEGATIVRVGSAIFGDRKRQASTEK